MTVLTSTMRMQLDAANFVRDAQHVADAVANDVRKIDQLKTALADAGASKKLQASMLKLGAGTEHVEGMRRALIDFRKEQGLTGKAWADLTKAEKAALGTFESATAATMRAIVKSEQDASAAVLRDIEQRNAALLAKESTLRERLLADDRRAEDKRVAMLAAAAVEKATISGREVAARAIIEAEITAKHRAGIVAREGASREELATIERIAGLEKEARIRAIQAETTAIVKAREDQAEAVAHAQAKNGAVHMVAGAVAGVVTAHAMVRPAEKAIESGADRQGVLIGMQRAGMQPAEMVRAQDLAVKVARDVGNMTATQVLELHKEARSAVQHPEEVFELMPDLARAAAALKGMGAEGNIADLVKAGESLGLMNSPERFRKFLDSQVRAQGVLGRTINTEQTYEAAKYTKSAGSTLSDDFLNLTLPSVIQELHGSSAGDAIASVNKTLRGGLAHQHLAVTQLQKMGLIEDPSQIIRAKGSGEIMGYSGKLRGDSLLASDPDRWFNEVFKPHAEAMGVKSQEDMNLLLSQVLGKQGANLGRIFIQQAETFAQHRENARNAPGTEAQIELQRRDPKVAVQTFNDALDDLGAAVTGPVMGRIGLGLTDLAGYVRNVSDIAKEHPIAALTVGGAATAGGLAVSGTLAYWVSTGFGLPAAAGHLSASAIALEAAATRLGAGGVAKQAVEAAPAAVAVTEAAAPALAIPGAVTLGAGAFGLGGAAAGAYVVKKAFEAQEPGRGGLYAPATKATEASDRQDLADLKTERDELARKVADQKARERIAGTSDVATESDRARIAQLDAAIANKQRSLDALPGFDVGGWTGPGGRLTPAGIVHKEEFVVRKGPAERHRELLERINRGDILPDYAAGGSVALARSGTGEGLVRVALAPDSTSGAWLRDTMRDAVTEALRQERGEAGDGAGGGVTGYGGGNLRFGRGADGAYRDTPKGRSTGGSGESAFGTGTGKGGSSIGDGDGTATTQAAGPGFTAGMRARNLGNIGYFGQKSPGLIGPSNSHDVDHSIALYATQEDGIRAAARLALHKYQSGMRNTATLIAAKKGGWTPGALGPGASVNIAKSMGLSNQDDLHLDDPAQMRKFLHGLAIQEHGSAGAYYTPEMIDRALSGRGSTTATGPEATVAPSVKPVASDSPDVAAARRYLLATASGPAASLSGSRADSISKLNPAFALKAAEAIRQARAEGINAGIFSGYRRPDQTGSLYDARMFSGHSYGVAADFAGIGTAGSATSRRFDEITRRLGLGGYGPDNRAEFNHKELGVHLQYDKARLDAMKRTLGPGGAMVDPAATWAASGYAVPKATVGAFPEVRPAAPPPLAARTLGGYIGMAGGRPAAPKGDPADMDQKQRDAERAVLPRRPAGLPAERHAAGVDFDHSGLDAAIAKVDTLHAKLRGLKSTASVDINHKHIHRNEAGPVTHPGAVRTSLNGRFGSDGRAWG